MDSKIPNRFYNINALRAISALGILLMHYKANMKVGLHFGFISDKFIPWCSDLVFLFMMISCFGMCCGYYEKTKRGELKPNTFYSKRYKRILPFFGLLCLLDLVMGFSLESLYQAFMDFTLVFNLLPNPECIKVIGVGWFLGLIFLFYLLFPYFVFLLDNKRRAWIIVVISLIINGLCQNYFFTPAASSINPGRYNFLFSAPFILVGGLCYLYRDTIFRLSEKIGHLGLIICILLTVAYFYVPQTRWSLGYVIPTIIIFASWLCYAIGPNHYLMHNKVIDFLSNISMEIYLCHMVIFRAIERLNLKNYFDNPDILYILTCCIGIIFSILFAYYVKLLLDRFINRIPGYFHKQPLADV